ncbi:methyl-accepting chemotaxis protein [Paenibacillus filicis]|uniref:Methyl-accepting chemotaxis protein n=1 Tax=Paenibacillus filicis TaxID=669464 RepID=A0ABU9DNC5_9BACL
MEILRNLKFRNKILILNVAAIVAILIVASIGSVYMNNMAQNTKKMYTDQLLPVKWVNAIQTSMRMNEASMLEFMLTKDEFLKSKMGKQNEAVDEVIRQYEQAAKGTGEADLFRQYTELLPDYRKAAERVLELASQNNEAKAYDAFVTEAGVKGNQLNELLISLSAQNEQVAEALYQRTEKEATAAKLMSWVATIIAIAIFIGVGYVINLVITNPIRTLQDLMKRAEAGDLSATGNYPYQDEVGALTGSYNKMLEGLRNLVNQVGEHTLIISASSEELLASTEQSASASEQIAQSSGRLEQELDKQATSIESAATDIYQIREHVVSIGDSSERMFISASQAAEHSKNGALTVSAASDQMKSIYSTVKELESTILQLGGHVREIGKFATVIREISTQTNLLSLNAAIEAARVGEAGKGFQVVAEEVRKLADESSGSSREIERLIASIQSEMNRIGSTMRDGLHEAELGLVKTDEAQVAFRQIDVSFDQVYTGVGEVKETIDQLLAGSERVVSVIEAANQVAREGMALSRQSSASSQEQFSGMEEIRGAADSLAKLSEELQQSLLSFRV